MASGHGKAAEVEAVLAMREGALSKPTDDDLRPVFDFLAQTFVSTRNEGSSSTANEAPHWFCAKTESPLHRRAATYLIFLFAYNRVERAHQWMKELEGVLKGCEKCARRFGVARREFDAKYMSKFPAQVRANFAAEVDKRQAEYINREYSAALDSSPESLSTPRKGLNALPPSIAQLAFSQPTVLERPELESIIRDTIEAGLQLPVRSLTQGRLTAGLVRLASSADEARRQWAVGQLAQCSRQPLEFEEWLSEGLGSEIDRLINAASDQAGDDKQEWSALLLILERGLLSEEAVRKGLLGGAGMAAGGLGKGVMPTLCPLLSSDSLGFRQILRVFTIILHISPTADIWSFDPSTELPPSLFADIKNNAAFMKLLETSVASTSNGDHGTLRPAHGTAISAALPAIDGIAGSLVWLQPYLESLVTPRKTLDAPSGICDLKPSASTFGETLARMCSFCFSEMQHDLYEAVLRAGVAQAGFQVLSVLQKHVENRESDFARAFSSTAEIHAAFITSVAFRHKDYPESNWAEARIAARDLLSNLFIADGRDIAESALGLARVAQEERARLRKAKQRRATIPAVRVDNLQKASVRTEVWTMAYEALRSIDPLGLSIVINSLAPFSHLELLDRGHSWRGDDLAEAISKDQWVAGIRAINAGIQATRSNFATAVESLSMQPDDGIFDTLWNVPNAVKSATVLLLSPVDGLHDPVITLLSRAFDCDERTDCFRALMTRFPGQAIDGLCEFLDRFVLIAQSSPESCSLAKWLVRCFTDILDVLCTSSGGVAPLLQSSDFLEDHTGKRSMSSRLRNLWHSMTTALAAIFKRTQAWAPLFDNDVMVDWMRDALIFGRQIADHIRMFEAAVLGQSCARTNNETESPVKITQSGRELVAQLHVVLVDLVSWLRLTDVETLHQTFQLIKEILTRVSKTNPDLAKEVKLAQALSELDKFCRKATKSHISRLSNDMISELSEVLQPFDLGLGEDDIQYIASIEAGGGQAGSSPVDARPISTERKGDGSKTKSKNAFEAMMKTAKEAGAGKKDSHSSPGESRKPAPALKAGSSLKPIDIDDFDDDFLTNLSTRDLDIIEKRAKTASASGLPPAGNDITRKSNVARPVVSASHTNSKLVVNVAPKTTSSSTAGSGKSIYGSGVMKDLRREHQQALAQRNKAPIGGVVPRLPGASSVGSGLGAYQPRKVQPLKADSGSSAEESSDDDDDGGGLTQLIKNQKSPLKPAKTVNIPRQIRRLGDPLSDMLSKREEERQRQHRMKQRLKPDLLPLYRHILGWDPTHRGQSPPHLGSDRSQLSAPVMIPTAFGSCTRYEQVMLPLFLQELWAQCQKEETARAPVSIEITARSYEDDFVDLEIACQGQLPERFFLNESDVMILQQPGNPKQLFAKVQHVRRISNDLLVKLRVLIAVDQASLSPKVKWLMYKHMSLSTAIREFAALRGLPYYEPRLLDDILAGRSAKISPLESFLISDAMKWYQVNQPQAKAILGALNTTGFALIQGPPGTGKTKTISGLVGKWLSDRPNLISITGEKPKRARLLVCAPSNAAIDEVCKRLMNGVPSSNGGRHQPIIVRIGIDASVNDAVKDRSLDNLVEARVNSDMAAKGGGAGEYSRLQAELEEVKQQIRTKQEQLTKLSHNEEGRSAVQNELHALMTRRTTIAQQASKAKDAARDASRHLDGARRNAREAILEEADIVCATLSGAGQDILAKHEFETVIIDEAAQAIELSCLIPLKYGCKRCIMVGDPNQLPPTTFSVEAEKLHYNQSLFVRMARAHPENLHLLSIQYRMHPHISELPSKVFYNGLLKDGPDMAANTAAVWHSQHSFGPYRFFNVTGNETRAGTSTKNADEAHVAVELYRRLEANFSEKVNLAFRIGVITMYKEQLFELKRAFNAAFGASILSTIEFNTVDGFQGQEKDIIILSCVRSGPNLNTIGFLKDARRMNVALTRAKSSLFVIGNASTLERGDERWKTIVGDARDRGFLIDYTSSTFAPVIPTGPPSVTSLKKKVKKADGPDVKPLPSPSKIARPGVSASITASPVKRKSVEGSEGGTKKKAKVDRGPSLDGSTSGSASRALKTPAVTPVKAEEVKSSSSGATTGDRDSSKASSEKKPSAMNGRPNSPTGPRPPPPPPPPPRSIPPPRPAAPPANPAELAFIKKKKVTYIHAVMASANGQKPVRPNAPPTSIPNVRQQLNNQYVPGRP